MTGYYLTYESRPEYAVSPTYTSEFDFDVVGSFTITQRTKPKANLVVEGFFPASDVDVEAVVTATALNIAEISVVSRASTSVTYIPSNIDINQVRTYLKIGIAPDEPFIISGKPESPEYSARYPFTGTANSITVVNKPSPKPVTPRPGRESSYTWLASDLDSTPALTKWKEHGEQGPAWFSGKGFEPRVQTRITFGPTGNYHTEDNVVVFDYKNVEHMWIDIGRDLTQDFTWIFCGIILSYPTAKYGHYVLDHGEKPPGKISRPLPKSERTAKILTNETGYRAAMLYQPRHATMGSHTGEDLVGNGRHIRTYNDYKPVPRMMYSIWNVDGPGGTTRGKIGTRGYRFGHNQSGRINQKTYRKFVTGRRFRKLSTDLASHMALFEIRFFDHKLTSAELRSQHRNLSSKYKFRNYT